MQKWWEEESLPEGTAHAVAASLYKVRVSEKAISRIRGGTPSGTPARRRTGTSTTGKVQRTQGREGRDARTGGAGGGPSGGGGMARPGPGFLENFRAARKNPTNMVSGAYASSHPCPINHPNPGGTEPRTWKPSQAIPLTHRFLVLAYLSDRCMRQIEMLTSLA